MQVSTYEHVFPLKKTCGISPLEHQASGILEDYSLLEYSLPLEISLPLLKYISLPLLKWLSFDVISLSPFDINFQEGPSRICREWVWSLSHRTKQQVEWDVGRVQDSLSGAGSKRMRKQVARCLSCSEIGDTELYGSVVPRGFDWTESIRPVRMSSS